MAHELIFVAPYGSPAGSGKADRPLHSFEAAMRAVRSRPNRDKPITVYFRAGTYYLPETVVFAADDSGTARGPVTYAAYPGEQAVLDGGTKLDLKWEPYRDGIMQARVPIGFTTDQLFINGVPQRMARYPNFDPRAHYLGGTSSDAFSRERAARWSDPTGGYIHALHKHLWGDFHYRLTGKDKDGNVAYEGGWQNNRRLGMHDEYRYVENIFEELDAPGEWFLDGKTRTLYYYPPADLDLNAATVEGVRLRSLIEFRGTKEHPVRHVALKGFAFRHAARTFMENKEPLLRSDWTIYRGGAILFAGVEDCALEDSTLIDLGGNAVFVSGYNRRITIRGCHISGAGANGVSFVGDPKAVRNPLFEYGERQNLADINRTPGPKTDDYPAECVVDDCLIHSTGREEKQSAPIEISMSESITVRHCSIYDAPRAGINIGDGCWGGHVIEYCDVFDAVKETGDHGSFNSWGRDRYWQLGGVDLNRVSTGGLRGLPLLDTVKPITLRNNRWRCDHGWDIDLDDGSTNYRMYDNLCLNGGIKLREGFYRVCENNVMVNGSFHPHVWFTDSDDVFRRNIVFTKYQPIEVPKPWGRDCDRNLLHRPGVIEARPAVELQEQSARDEHSIAADAEFLDPAAGDYRVAAGSPALKLGFKNFPMDRFGVQSPRLKVLARTPLLPEAAVSPPSPVAPDLPAAPNSARDAAIVEWMGARIKNVAGMGEVSAAGLASEAGVRIVEAPAVSAAARVGLCAADVILKIDGKPCDTVRELLSLIAATKPGEAVRLLVWRDQREMVIAIHPAP